MSMYPKSMLFTSESVPEGHPDKFCDRISDAVVDEGLRRDPLARVAAMAAKTNSVTCLLSSNGGWIFPTSQFRIFQQLAALHKEYLSWNCLRHS